MTAQTPTMPEVDCLIAAATTPLTPTLQPDLPRLLSHVRWLLEEGCDGVALFGTTGEGPEFSDPDRMAALEHLISGGIDPGRLLVSISALSIPSMVALADHAIGLQVCDLLLMPPCVFRSGITEDSTFRFYSAVIERIANPQLRLYLYHFPDICGVSVTPQVVRRLDERYAGIIAGVKDSGGDLDYTENLVRRFSHLSIFTGTEIHLPQALAAGARGTVCGLANVMPKLMRAMMDLPTSFDRRKLVPALIAGDTILSRGPFIAAAKAVLAAYHDDPSWRDVVPPMAQLSMVERQHVISDFYRWDAGLPEGWRSLCQGTSPAPAAAQPFLQISAATA